MGYSFCLLVIDRYHAINLIYFHISLDVCTRCQSQKFLFIQFNFHQQLYQICYTVHILCAMCVVIHNIKSVYATHIENVAMVLKYTVAKITPFNKWKVGHTTSYHSTLYRSKLYLYESFK